MQTIFIKKCFLFTLGSLSRKAVHNWIEKFSQGGSKVADDARSGGSGRDNSQKTHTHTYIYSYIYTAGFGTLVKQWETVSMLVEDMSRNKYFIPGSNITRFTFYIHF
jgi:hypothetical protein